MSADGTMNFEPDASSFHLPVVFRRFRRRGRRLFGEWPSARRHVTNAPAAKETLNGFTLDQWGVGGNTFLTNEEPPVLLPMMVAGPWATYYVVSDKAVGFGLKR